MSEPKEPDRILFIGIKEIDAGVANGQVAVRLRGIEDEAGLVPGLGVCIVLSPLEAHQFAEALHKTALQAESESPRH